MKTFLAPLACLLVLLALAAAACGDDDNESTSTPAPSATAHTATPTLPPSTPTQTAAANVCVTNPDPATPGMNHVTTPVAGDQISTPAQVQGQIAAFEATFKITIYDAQQNVIVDKTAMSNEGQTLAPFSTTIDFTVTTPTPACMWVYEASARDGLPIHVVQIPVTLIP